MQLLQDLLACLFTFNSALKSHPASSGLIMLPSDAALTPKHAIPFTRILTTLCSPSISSVSGHRNRHLHADLVDVTKQAKAYAGQYVPSLLMQYCKCQLNGRLEPGVREKLVPGLYACMDIMIRDTTMRAMNEAMDAGGRAIWRALYSEWVRFGKWKG